MILDVISPFHSSYEKGCQGKKASPRPSERCGRGDLHPAPPHPLKKDVKEKRHPPAPLRDAGVVTYIQPHLIPHLILRGGIGLVALARRTFPRRYQPQLL